MADEDPGKASAAARALELVQPGMLIGLGTGSTSRLFIEGLAALVRQGLHVKGVPTSRASAQLSRRLGVPIVEELTGPVDLAVDGADEIDPNLSLIKGRGGALLREKVMAASARRFVVIASAEKLVRRLGVGVLPVEVAPFGWRTTAARLGLWSHRLELRGGEDTPYTTDNGNLIIDLAIEGGIADPEDLSRRLSQVPGVLEHGLFVGLVTGAIVGSPEGTHILGSLE